MKFHPRWAVTALFVVALGASSMANAALVSRLGGLAVYDTDLNITWLANANANGLMDWATANTWAAGLTVGGVSGWRLPTSDACNGFNCTGSEMGHLFYNELGGTASSSILSSTDPDLALFTNVQSTIYWSGTVYAPDTTYAWLFNFGNGNQSASYKSTSRYALAVRPGDVAAVPVPAAFWLFGSGLLGLIGVARRKAA